MQSYLKKQSEIRKRQVTRIAFQDWNILKPMWQEFTDLYLTSKLHFIICGRAGFDYDYFENEQGEMELYKTNTKMKVESEFGYEPSLLIEMERIRGQEPAKTKKGKGQAKPKIEIGSTTIHRAHVIKDRSQFKSLDGMIFDNPTFESFMPHFQAINIGGEHFVETRRDSQDLFQSSFEGKPSWKIEQEQKEIIRAEIKGNMDKYFPGTGAKEKRAKIILKDHVFNVKSDEGLDPIDLSTLKIGKEYLEWLLKDQELIQALMEGQEEILKSKKEEWYIFNSEIPNVDIPNLKPLNLGDSERGNGKNGIEGNDFQKIGRIMIKKFNCPHCGIEHEILISFDQFILTKCSNCGGYILKALLMKDRKPDFGTASEL